QGQGRRGRGGRRRGRRRAVGAAPGRISRRPHRSRDRGRRSRMSSKRISAVVVALLALGGTARAQEAGAPPSVDPRLYEIAGAAQAERIEKDVRKLVSFGTRHTLSDTVSETRGIGAARRWIKAEFDRISAECGGCLEVFYQRHLVKGDPRSRIPRDTWI